MPHLFLKFFCIICLGMSHALGLTQVFPRQDATYVYVGGGFWSHGITTMQYEKDTLAQGRILHKCQRKGFWVGPEGADTSSVELGAIFFNTIDQTVEYSIDAEHFDTLYNFAALPGSTWSMRWNIDHILDGPILVEIVDTFSRRDLNLRLRCQAVDWHMGTSIYQDTVCQMLGSIHMYVLPWDIKDIARDGGEGGPLRCYSDRALGVVSFPEVYIPFDYPYDCVTELSQPKMKPIPALILYPNPTSAEVRIQLGDAQTASIEIMDVLGETVIVQENHVLANPISIRHLPPGIYFVRNMLRLGQVGRLLVQ